jgi:uncharacterized protein (DUF1800 family)
VAGLAVAGSAIPGRLRDNPTEFAKFTRPLAENDRLRHALDRLTFGSRPGDLARLKAIGFRRWVNAQLHPEIVPENPVLDQKLAPLEILRLSPQDAFVRYPSARRVSSSGGRMPAGADDSDITQKTSLIKALSAVQIERLRTGTSEEKQALMGSISPDKYSEVVWALRRGERRALFPFAPAELRRQLMIAVNPQLVVASDLTEGKILRAAYSTHQLQELLVDFWYNHFNVFLGKGADHYLVPSYERDAIRPHVFGKFYDLLLATAESPAMLFYLDNWQSVGADTTPPPRQANNRYGLNENYGRELLELHTLGVGSGYTQQDVIEVARCFTGWTITNPRKSGAFEYNDRMHDKGRKVVLGHVIEAGGGMNDGLEVLSLLAHHPSTAHFISLELAQRFVADNPPPSLVNRMAATFLARDGDLREVTRTMINSPEFWSEGAFRVKIKTPFEMVVSTVRASQADLQSTFLLGNEIQRLGEPLYRKSEPTGYSSANDEWVSSANLLERMNFAVALAHNRIPGVSVDPSSWEIDPKDPLHLARSLLDAEVSATTRQAIDKAIEKLELEEQLAAGAKAGPPQLPSLIAGLTLGSPEFQRR